MLQLLGQLVAGELKTISHVVLHLQAETQPGFINALLDILQAEQNNAVQLSGECLFDVPVLRHLSDISVRPCSRRLSEEPHQPRVVARRRYPAAHPDSRLREAWLQRTVDPRSGVRAVQCPRSAGASPPENPAA